MVPTQCTHALMQRVVCRGAHSILPAAPLFRQWPRCFSDTLSMLHKFGAHIGGLMMT